MKDKYVVVDMVTNEILNVGTYGSSDRHIIDREYAERGSEVHWDIDVELSDVGKHWQDGQVVSGTTREKLAADIADARWQYETGGTTWQGKPVSTEREAVAQLGTMVDYGHSSGSWPEKWKLADGMFHVLRTDEYVSLRATVHAHVQQAFMWEDDELQRLANTPDSDLVNFKVRIK